MTYDRTRVYQVLRPITPCLLCMRGSQFCWIEPPAPSRSLSLGAGKHVSVVRSNVSARTQHTVGTHVNLDSRRATQSSKSRSHGLQPLHMQLNWASLPICSTTSSLYWTSRLHPSDQPQFLLHCQTLTHSDYAMMNIDPPRSSARATLLP